MINKFYYCGYVTTAFGAETLADHLQNRCPYCYGLRSFYYVWHNSRDKLVGCSQCKWIIAYHPDGKKSCGVDGFNGTRYACDSGLDLTKMLNEVCLKHAIHKVRQNTPQIQL